MEETEEQSVYFKGVLFTFTVSHILASIFLIAGAIKKSTILIVPWIGMSILAFFFVMVKESKQFYDDCH